MMVVFIMLKELILMIYYLLRINQRLKELVVFLVASNIMTRLLFINNGNFYEYLVTSSFQLHFKKVLMQIMLIDFPQNLLFKLQMGQPHSKESKFYFLKEFNSFLIFYVMLVVLLLAILNG